MPDIPARYAPYIGRPWTPPDGCFLLVRDILAEQFGFRPEIGADQDVATLRGQVAAFRDGLARLCRPVDQPREGDLVVVCTGGRPYHIGLCVAPGRMIHCIDGAATCIQRWSDVSGQKEFWRVG